MRRRHINDETMGAARPVGCIRRCRCHVCCLMVSGDDGGHGGGVGRVRGGRYRSTNHDEDRVTVFFDNTMCVEGMRTGTALRRHRDGDDVDLATSQQ